MKNKRNTLETEPLGAGASILDIKKAGEEAGRAMLANARVRSMKADIRKKELKKPEVTPISTTLKKVHSLGDFYGKYHPSKSNKGIKRSE